MYAGQLTRTVAGDYITSVGFDVPVTEEKDLLRSILILAVLVLALPAAAGDVPAPQRVLFVGNSFTFYNNSLHNHYKFLRAAANGGELYGRTRLLGISGGHLPEHAAGLQQRLDSEDWDIVVLQGHSIGPISDGTAESFKRAARRYATDIRADGGEPVFFMTWAYTSRPEMIDELDAAYTGVGEELGAAVVPVGRAFQAALASRPELQLVMDDDKHPTLAGTYLAACIFFAALHGETPVGVDYAAGLSDKDARFLQQVAWDSWQEYQGG